MERGRILLLRCPKKERIEKGGRSREIFSKLYLPFQK
jgi:hypothetical protein